MGRLSVIILTLFGMVLSFNSFAKNYNLNSDKTFPFLGPEELKLERPLFKESQITLQPKALAGDVEAEYETALRYYYGYVRRLDVPFYQSYEKAAYWFKKAVSQRHPESAYFLGIMYMSGTGVSKDNYKAIQYLAFAKEKGIKQATYALAELSFNLYKSSDKLDFYKPDYLVDAKRLYKELADKKEPRAVYNLALLRYATENHTRYLKEEIGDLLLKAVKGFSEQKNEKLSIKTINLIRKWDLPTIKQAQDVFNHKFIADKTNLPRLGDKYREE